MLSVLHLSGIQCFGYADGSLVFSHCNIVFLPEVFLSFCGLGQWVSFTHAATVLCISIVLLLADALLTKVS